MIKCSEYETHALDNCIKTLLDMLSFDWGKIKDRRILLKPNLLGGFVPEAAVTTHPAVVEVVANQIIEFGHSGCIGDSPGNGVLLNDLKEVTGMEEVSMQTKLPLLDLGQGNMHSLSLDNLIEELPINQIAKDNIVISLPKLKTSRGVLLTCAVKNMFGCVAGKSKERLHLYGKEPEIFYTTLNKVCKEVSPHLTIVDGITMMEGNGPDAGNPVPLGLLIAGYDPFAVDWVIAKCLNLNPMAVGCLRYAIKDGMTFDDVEIICDDSIDFPIYEPKLPRLLSGSFHKWEDPRMR